MKTFYNLRAFFSLQKKSAQLAQCLALLAMVAWPSSRLFAQAPAISYSTPQTYVTGTPVTPLAPASTGVAAWGYSSGTVTAASGFSILVDVAVDAAGNMYTVDVGNGQVVKTPAGGGTPVVLASGFNNPRGIACDAAGNIYVTDSGNNLVKEIPAGSSTASPIGSGFSFPGAVAVDGAGNVYVADNGSGSVIEIQAGSGAIITLISGFANVAGVAVDAAGILYVADEGVSPSGDGVLYKILPGSTMVPMGTGLSRPTGVVADAAGNLYVSDLKNSAIIVIEPNGTQFTIGSGFTLPNGVALDRAGNVYIADSANGVVKEVKITGGYFLSPFLPAGLTFNNSTGIISGTPIAASPAANYTVKAYNSTGSGTATVNITTPLSPSPVISYSTPQTYRLANAITPLPPVNTGGAVAAFGFNPATTPVSTGISDVNCMAMDKAGNLYIGENSGQVSVLPAGGSTASVFATGFGPVYSIALDASNNVYVGDSAHLWKILAGGGTPVTLGSLSSPVGIAFDAAGNLYVADNAGSDEGVYKMAPDGTGQTRIDNGIRQPAFLAFDANGNLFIADQYNNALYEMPVYGPQKQVASGFSTPVSLTTDPSGNVYLADQHAIYCYSAIAGLINFAPVSPYGLMADANFNLYYSSLYDGTIYKISPHGGYFTSPELPPGLTINPNSGIINGTPLAASAATNYRVTGFNGPVSSTATVNITVGLPPPPVINYSTPQIYTASTAITPLSPVSTGGAVAGPAFNTVTTNLNTGFFDATCMARDQAGNFYIGESTGRVSVLHPGSNGASVFATGFTTNSIRSIAADAPGNVYAADGASVWKIPAGGGAAVKLGSFVNPVGVASDPAGNLYVADNDVSNGGAYKITTGGTIQQLQMGPTSEAAADMNGNIFLGSGFQEIGGLSTSFDVVLNNITAFTIDPIGNIYLADLSSGTTTLYLLPANRSGKVAVGPTFSSGTVTGLMACPDLNLYAVINGGILKMNATGGYFISPELPRELVIDPTTGAITGTPAAGSLAANYTVAAFNNGVSGTATVNITVNLPPPPVISYSTPQTYTTGTAITPLQPLNTGSPVAGLGFNAVATTLNTGFSDATCLAWGKDGNIYIGESSGKVSVLPPGSGPATVFASGFGPVAGIAIDASGNVYVADGSSSIRKIPAGGGTPVLLGSFSRPAGVALDAPGNIYVADAGGNGVYKMAADGTGQTKITDGSVFDPGSVAVDANGNVFVVDEDFNQVFEIPAGGAEKTVTGWNNALSITTDASGNIYVGSNAGAGLFFITASQSVSGTIGSSLRGIVTAVMVDPNFNLYAVDGGAISKINTVSGYFVSPELPAGVTIDPNSGAISGMPSAVSPAANYTVTAFSNSVSGNAAVNITVNPALPVISYATPQTYTEGAAITPLLPSSTGGGVAAFGYSTGSPTVINTGLGDAFSIAMDKSGDLYIGQFSGNVAVLPAGGSTATAFATGFGVVFSMALDTSNNVYLADGVHVWKIPAGGGTPATLGSFQSPAAVAFDSAGYLYVADNSSGAGGVYRMAADGTGKIRIDNNLQGPAALAFDANGNLFIGDQHSTALYEIPAGGAQTLVASGFSFPIALTTDASGNVFMSDIQATYCYSAGAGVVKIDQVATHGLTTDANFNLYYTANSNVYKISPTGGYFTSPELPKGLTINPTSGAISGTPNTVSPAAGYTVTAFSAWVNGTASVKITVNAPLPPIINYSTPQTYITNTAISPLTPSSTGSAVTAFGYGAGSPALINTGLSSSLSIATDKSGNLYIGQHTGSIAMLPAGGSVATVLATGFGSVFGITLDASNNIYFADGAHVWTMPAGGGTPVTIGSGFQSPVGVAFDAAGYLYVADNSGGAGGVYKMAADGTGKIRIDNNLQAPSTVAFDAIGNLFIGDQRSGALFEIPAGGTQMQMASGFFSPLSLTTDASGNVFMSDTRATYCYSAGAGVVKIDQVATHGLMTDANFNLYYTFNNNVYKISPTGGYFTSPELPAGLTIDPNNGVISGTPTTVSPAANYTVTAFTAFRSGIATVNITVNPLILSYNGPQVYTAGTAITPLTPTVNGTVAPQAYSGGSVTIANSFHEVGGIAADAAGNIYVVDMRVPWISTPGVYKIPAGGGPAASIGSGFQTPSSIAVDHAGNVYVGDGTAIKRIAVSDGSITIVAQGFIVPAQLAIDAAGNIYAADAGGNAVKEILAANGNVINIGSGFNVPTGVAVDASGNVYVADAGNGAVKEIQVGGGISTLTSGPVFGSLTLDAAGNLYVTNLTNNVIDEIPAGGTIKTIVNSPAQQIVLDGAGNLYYAMGGTVSELKPAGGYYMSPFLPAGLSFNSATGVISGTPAAASPAANYTITAYSGAGSGTAAVNITVNPSAPTLSYATPQVYVQNAAITPLVPVSTNVGAPAYLSTSTTAGTFTQPFATAVDQSGNVYIADKSANSLYELLAGGGQTTVGTGLNTPASVAVDKSGNVYTVSQGDNAIVKIQAHTGTQTNVGSSYQRPTALAVDSAGNVFVADVQGAAGVVYKIAPGQSKQLFKGGFISPNGIAVDAAGNVYVSDFGGGATPSMVYEISPDGSTETPINHTFSTATGVAIDATGNLFITDAGNTDIIEYPAGGGSAITLTAGLTFPFGLSADGAGNLYVADPGANKVVKLNPEGGCFINRALTSGLTLDAATGIISGTPTAASPVTDYTVTAYNITGSGTATINIKVTSTDATLASLSLSSGKLSPAFSPGGISYTAGVPYSANSITVTAIPTDAGATVVTKVNGSTASGSAPLNAGPNTITVKVTAADGTTTKTYTVTVTPVASQNAYLSGINPSSGHLSPTFAQATTNYTLSVSNAIAAMTVTPVSTNPGATIKVNGLTLTSGSTSNPVALPPGVQTTINIAVTAPNGHIITYTVTVTRAPDVIATLSNIQLSTGTLTPVFTPAALSYSTRLTNLNTSIAITSTATDPNATIAVNGSPVASGSPVTINNLAVGDNNVNIVVTAQDGTTKKTYTVTVNRPPSINCFLASMNPGKQPLSPIFAPSTTDYTLEVDNTTAMMTLAPVTAEAHATMTINNAPATSGTRSGPIALNLGPNVIKVVVTAQDGVSKKAYTITVTRDAPPVADIANTVYQPISVEKPINTPTLAEDGIVVHQGISPNGDGLNDFLQIDNISQYPENKLSIMNRNGQLVYEAKGYDNSSKAFDGHSNKNGQMQLPGTYFYQLDYTVNGTTKHKTGFLVLKY